jgi:hypothetical protein
MFEAPGRVAAAIADFIDECAGGADRQQPPAS